MTAGVHDFLVEQEATFRQRMTWTRRLAAGEPSAPGDTTKTLPDGTTVTVRPYDLTNCTARRQIRRGYDVDPEFLTLTVGNGLTLGGTAGTIDIHLTAAQTDSLTVKRARYDLLVTFPGGDVRRVLEGRLLISRNVTELP